MRRLSRVRARWLAVGAAVLLLALVGSLAAFGGARPGAPSAPAVVWAVGDGADGSRPGLALSRRIVAEDPKVFLYLGDVYPDGTAKDYAQRYRPAYGRLDSRTLPTPGNHEWPQRVEGYLPYWGRAHGAPEPSYYAAETAGWQLLSLNSEEDHGAGSEQLAWLRRQLAARAGTCRIAFWHRPRFSAGSHGDQADMAPVWGAVRGQAAIVLNGHDHNLQRFKPIGGTTAFVVGAGGGERYPLKGDDSRLAYANDTVAGALRLELNRDSARFSLIDPGGHTLDRGTIPCHAR